MVSVCVGNEFSVNSDGQLKLELAGDPAARAMPPGLANPLRVDPERGLWADLGAAETVAPIQYNSGERTKGTDVNAGFPLLDEVFFNVVNANKTRVAWCMVAVQHRLRVHLPAKGGATLRATATRNPADGAVDARTIFNDSAETRVHWERINQTLIFSINPGLTASVHLKAGLFAHGAGARFQSVLHGAAGLNYVF